MDLIGNHRPDLQLLGQSKKSKSCLTSEQAYASLQCHQSSRGVWTAIADWRAAAHGRQSDDWPLDSGPVGIQEIEAWRDCSTGREVQIG
jgi:hypothetical protein